MTFKDLQKKLVQQSQYNSEQTKLFEKLRNKPFWIWDIAEHKLQDIKTKGYCCFNHIIGLPKKDGIDKPLYDYERIIFDSLYSSPSISDNGNNEVIIKRNDISKHLWIKKATG